MDNKTENDKMIGIFMGYEFIPGDPNESCDKHTYNMPDGRCQHPGFLFDKSRKGWNDFESTNKPLPIFNPDNTPYMGVGEVQGEVVWQYNHAPNGCDMDWVDEQSEKGHAHSLRNKLPTRKIYRDIPRPSEIDTTKVYGRPGEDNYGRDERLFDTFEVSNTKVASTLTTSPVIDKAETVDPIKEHGDRIWKIANELVTKYQVEEVIYEYWINLDEEEPDYQQIISAVQNIESAHRDDLHDQFKNAWVSVDRVDELLELQKQDIKAWLHRRARDFGGISYNQIDEFVDDYQIVQYHKPLPNPPQL